MEWQRSNEYGRDPLPHLPQYMLDPDLPLPFYNPAGIAPLAVIVSSNSLALRLALASGARNTCMQDCFKSAALPAAGG